MARQCVTKDAVFTIAQTLAQEGLVPTQAKVRTSLGFGSMHTIHGYLQEWKKQCFTTNKASALLPGALVGNDLAQEKKFFEKTNQQLQLQINNLTTELKAAAKRANKWQYQAERLQVEVATMTEELKQVRTQYEHCQEMLQEKEKSLEFIVNYKELLITSLRQELKETTHQAIVEAREYNHEQHEAIMQVKIENINLQEEMKLLAKKLKEQEELLVSAKLNAAL